MTQGQALAPDMTVAVMQATRGGLTLYAKLGFVDTGFTSLHTREVNMRKCAYASVVTNPSIAIRTATKARPVDAAVAVPQCQALATDMAVAVMHATRGGLTLYAKLGSVDTGFTSLHTREVKGALSRWKRTVSFIHFRNSINWGAKMGTVGSWDFDAGISYQVSCLVVACIYRRT